MLVPVYKTISHHIQEYNLNFKFGDYHKSQICWLGLLTNPFHIQTVVGSTHKEQYSDWILRKVQFRGSLTPQVQRQFQKCLHTSELPKNVTW